MTDTTTAPLTCAQHTEAMLLAMPHLPRRPTMQWASDAPHVYICAWRYEGVDMDSQLVVGATYDAAIRAMAAVISGDGDGAEDITLYPVDWTIDDLPICR